MKVRRSQDNCRSSNGRCHSDNPGLQKVGHKGDHVTGAEEDIHLDKVVQSLIRISTRLPSITDSAVMIIRH